MLQTTERSPKSPIPESASDSPFLNQTSFSVDDSEVAAEQESVSTSPHPDSPFSSVYELEGEEGLIDPEAEEFAELLAELYDEEFDDAVFEIINEAEDFYENQLSAGFGNPVTQEAEAERLLETYIEPLATEVEMLLDHMAQAIDQSDFDTMSEAEIEALVDQYETSQALSPTFEHFWGAFKKVVKKVASGAKKLAKKGIKIVGKVALRAALGKLKGIAKAMLQRVLKRAIRKLPSRLRPIARRLKKKYLGEIEEEEDFEEGEDLIQDVAQIQHEFDLQIANLLFASEEVEQDAAITEYVTESQQPAEDPIGDLDRARAEFISQISQLEEDEDPTPHVENFAPAIIMAAKLAIKVIGRKRVVRFLAKPIARLIRRFVGKRYALALSRATADAGLRVIGLEVTPEDEAEVAASTVAEVVEDTVRQVAQLPGYIQDDEALLEGYVTEAFESAAAKNLPHVLPEDVYKRRPELREACGVNGAWVMLPLRGKKYYKKFTRVLGPITICPHVTQIIKTFGGVPLATCLRDGLGLSVGSGIKARVHLYEAIPGCRLYHISKYEKNVPGLGTSAKTAWSQIQPLTTVAASLLTGEPYLGRDVSPKYLAHRRMIDTGGQRFYYLEIDGARPQMATTPSGLPALRRSTEVNLTMNFPQDQLQLFIFLSEADSQDIAVKLRQQAPIGSALKLVMSVLETGLKLAFSDGMYHRVKIVHPAVAPGPSSGAALKRLAPVVVEKLTAKLLEWVGSVLATYFKRIPSDFTAATEDEMDGVTLAMTINNPPGFSIIRKLLSGDSVSLRGAWYPEGIPNVNLQIFRGYRRD